MGLWDELWGILLLVKACLNSFWFWLPVLFAVYFYIQLWMMFFVHPLTILILPIILTVTAIQIEKKQTKLQYGLNKDKLLKSTRPLGETPEEVEWKVQKLVEEYKKRLEEEKHRKEN